MPGSQRAAFVWGLPSGSSQSHFHLFQVGWVLLTIPWASIWKKWLHVWPCISNVMCLTASPTHFALSLFPFIWISYDVSCSSNACSFFFCFTFGLEHSQVVPSSCFCIYTAFIKLPQQIWVTDKRFASFHSLLLQLEFSISLWAEQIQKILWKIFKTVTDF